MTVRYIGKREADIIPNKEYEVISIERGWYRSVDESGEDYLYGPSNFEIVNDSMKEKASA